MISTLLYFWYVLMDGDWKNDWLTHLPPAMRPITSAVGRMLADLFTCGDPTLPANWTPAMVPIARLLAVLHDLLTALGIC